MNGGFAFVLILVAGALAGLVYAAIRISEGRDRAQWFRDNKDLFQK